VHDLLADQCAAGVVAVTADPGGLPDVGEADVPRTGNPDRAADDPAVAAVQFRVIGVARAGRLDGIEDRALEFLLVAFDGYLELSRQPGL
jgi:hypothetical protein